MATAVKHRDMAATFRALGDPVRRAMVEHLSNGDATVNDLAALFPITVQAVSQHIKVLENAGVVTRLRIGQTRPVSLRPASLTETADWIAARTRQVESRYQRLDDLVAELQQGTSP
ncbi:metalloregulator ArsR/SmtB family transcription factor [soil metagenome]